MSSRKYDLLKLDAQVGFPLYAASREVVKQYRPFLEEIDLTYTQFITMSVLWEEGTISAGLLGKRLYLDSGTLTPLLKSLEKKGFIIRKRSSLDERVLMVYLTKEGEALKEKAVKVPEQMMEIINISPEESKTLYTLLYKILGKEV